jgi:protein CpxP
MIRKERGEKMQRKYLSIAIGLFLSAGLAIAQAPVQSQPQQPAAQQQPLATENAPAAQQGQRPHAHNPARAAHRLGRQLGLSQDQVAQIKPILASRQQQMETLRADSTLTEQDRRAKAHSIMQGSRSQIEALLSDSQKQQYEQMLAARRAQHQQHNSAPQAQ